MNSQATMANSQDSLASTVVLVSPALANLANRLVKLGYS